MDAPDGVLAEQTARRPLVVPRRPRRHWHERLAPARPPASEAASRELARPPPLEAARLHGNRNVTASMLNRRVDLDAIDAALAR